MGDHSWDDDELRKALICIYPGKENLITDEAIKFVKESADKSKNGTIERQEVRAAVQAYTVYMDRKEEIDKVLSKYDQDQDGKEVTDDDVDLVLQMCDTSRNEHIDPDEIKKA